MASFVASCFVTGCVLMYFPVLHVGEAVNVSSGLGYNGVDERGKARWNLVDNADILQIEVLVIFLIFVEKHVYEFDCYNSTDADGF